MTGLSSTVISNLAYVVGALVLAIILGIAVWWRHRQPKSVDANVASFKRGLRALSPENRPAGVRIVTSGAGRGPNGAGGTEPMRFTSIKLERVAEPAGEPDSVESPEDQETPVAGEIDEAGGSGAGGSDRAEPDSAEPDSAEADSDGHLSGEHEAGGDEAGGDEAGGDKAGGDKAGGDGVVAPGALGLEAVAQQAHGPDAGEQGGEGGAIEQAGEGGAIGQADRGEAGDQPVAAPSVAEEGVGHHTVQRDDVLMGDDNSPAAAEASGHPAGGESG